MSYDYKIINVDPSTAFVKRALLYIAILLITISLALIVLFILFERYLSLLIPGGLIILSVMTIFILCKRGTSIEYSYSDKVLKVVSDRGEVSFELSKISIEKNAEKSDFFDKKVIKLSFIKNKIAIKLQLNDNTISAKNYLFVYNEQSYIAAFDDYALALIEGAKDED